MFLHLCNATRKSSYRIHSTIMFCIINYLVRECGGRKSCSHAIPITSLCPFPPLERLPSIFHLHPLQPPHTNQHTQNEIFIYSRRKCRPRRNRRKIIFISQYCYSLLIFDVDVDRYMARERVVNLAIHFAGGLSKHAFHHHGCKYPSPTKQHDIVRRFLASSAVPLFCDSFKCLWCEIAFRGERHHFMRPSRS